MPGSLFLQPSTHPQAMHIQIGHMPTLRIDASLIDPFRLAAGMLCQSGAAESLMGPAHYRYTALTGTSPLLT